MDINRSPWPSRDEVALGAFLHDIGKFMQRAHGALDAMPRQVRERASDVLPSFQGVSSHWHALWSDAFFEEVVDKHDLPRDFDRRWIRDCAVYHHKPLQDGAAAPLGSVTWLVTEADRVASGMERKRRDEEQEREPAKRDAYRKTLLTSIFAELAIHKDKPVPDRLRQPLRELNPNALMPERRDSNTDPELPRHYAKLWAAFVADYAALVDRVKDDVDEFHWGLLSLSERFMWAVPSSTIDEPDVSLHDHARAVAAVAACLHAHHEYFGGLTEEGAIRDRARPKFRFLVGDLSGIQTALFRLASEGAKGLARVLRGRSLRFQLIGEAAARTCLKQFGLPPYCVLQNAGGRFLLLLPFTDDDRQRADLDHIRSDVDRWMRDQYQGDLILNLALSKPFAAADLIAAGPGQAEPKAPSESKSKKVLELPGQAAEEAKQNPLAGARYPVFRGEWDAQKGPCSTCGVRPALKTGPQDDRHRCPACYAETELGRAYPKALAVALDRHGIPERLDEIFDYNIGLPDEAYRDRPAAGWRMRGAADHPNLPAADRFFRAYVPRHDDKSVEDEALKRARRESGDEEEARVGEILTFAELAARSVERDEKGRQIGRPMLAALKADVDRLGQVFTRGLGKRRTLARSGALSRMMDAFFTGHLPHRLKTESPNIYTVYAGGDDLLLLGPWRDMLSLARTLREDFRTFVGGSEHVTLSAGIALFAPKTPITLAAKEAEERLSKAKDDGRDRIHAVLPLETGALSWDEYDRALRDADRLHALVNDPTSGVTTALVYKLLWLDDRRRACEAGDTNAADWRAKFSYHLARALPKANDARETERARTRSFLLGLMGLDATLKPLEAGGAGGVSPPGRLALSIAIYRNR